MLRRKIYDDLVTWKKESNGTSAILIDGARRVGKSYIAKEFAEKEYRSYIVIDFGNAPKDIVNLIENESYNLDLFFMKLSSFTLSRFTRETLSSSSMKYNNVRRLAN